MLGGQLLRFTGLVLALGCRPEPAPPAPHWLVGRWAPDLTTSPFRRLDDLATSLDGPAGDVDRASANTLAWARQQAVLDPDHPALRRLDGLRALLSAPWLEVTPQALLVPGVNGPRAWTLAEGDDGQLWLTTTAGDKTWTSLLRHPNADRISVEVDGENSAIHLIRLSARPSPQGR